jgi:hypothetical protein
VAHYISLYIAGGTFLVEPTVVPGQSSCVLRIEVATIVAGMVAGADSIDDLDVVRHGGLPALFGGCTPRRRWARSCAGSATGTGCSWPRPGVSCWSSWPAAPGCCPVPINCALWTSTRCCAGCTARPSRERRSGTPTSAATRCCCAA